MIVWREQPELLPIDNKYLVFNFKYEADNYIPEWDELEGSTTFGTDRVNNWPYIDISESTFENLNQGKAITHISIVEDDYYWDYIAEMPTDTNGKHHPYFDHHGAVLNIAGFPGKIDFSKNSVKNNMYFVNDVYPGFRNTR